MRPDGEKETRSVVELIDYGISLRSLDENELSALHEELRSQGAPTRQATIKLALLLGYGNSPDYDLDRAINLLNQVARTRRGNDASLRDFAELMAALLIERRGLAVERDALAEERADIAADLERARALADDLRNRLEQTRSDLEDEREQRNKLQSQLDALIELEERLTLDDVPDDGAANEQ